MGLFNFGKKKEKFEIKKLESSIDEKGIARYKCPYCLKTLFEGYYMTVKVEPIEACPHCGKTIAR